MSYYTDHGEVLYQIRLNVIDDFKEEEELTDLLKSQNASLMCQYDAFASFVKDCDNNGETDNPLYRWTKDTINDEKKKKKYKNIYSVYFNKQQVYKEDIANDMIEAIENLKLKTIIEINKLDTQPKNNPQPPKKYSE